MKKDPEPIKKSANNGDISIRDIKKPDEEKKAPLIKVDNLDTKPAADKVDKPKI